MFSLKNSSILFATTQSLVTKCTRIVATFYPFINGVKHKPLFMQAWSEASAFFFFLLERRCDELRMRKCVTNDSHAEMSIYDTSKMVTSFAHVLVHKSLLPHIMVNNASSAPRNRGHWGRDNTKTYEIQTIFLWTINCQVRLGIPHSAAISSKRIALVFHKTSRISRTAGHTFCIWSAIRYRTQGQSYTLGVMLHLGQNLPLELPSFRNYHGTNDDGP